MTAVADHYDQLLAANYTWMLGGDLETVTEAQAGLLRELGVAPVRAGKPPPSTSAAARARRPWR